MQKAKQLRNERIVIQQGRFIVEIKAYEVPSSRKFPDGIEEYTEAIQIFFAEVRKVVSDEK